MKSNLAVAHTDATLKGVAVGVVSYVAAKFGLADEAVAVLIPLVAYGLSLLSTRIGDKNTALVLKLVETAAKSAPAKAPAKKKK